MSKSAYLMVLAILVAIPHVATGAADLSSFEVLRYSDNVQPSAANWVLASDGMSVTQTTNNRPSFFLDPNDAVNLSLEWDARVNSTDDDGFGFVWGWQEFGNFYLFGWGNSVAPSMSVGKAIGGSLDPFFPPGQFDPTPLATSTVHWANNTVYHFLLEFVPGQTVIEITQGSTLVESFLITDTTYSSGRFGFYTHSLGSVTFSNLVPEPNTALLLMGALVALGIARRPTSGERAASILN